MAPSRVVALPTCSICQDEEAGSDYSTTLCGHAFHYTCIRSWDTSQRAQRRATRCPSCNVELKRISLGNTKALGSRFVRLHSLTERTINRSSSPLSGPEDDLETRSLRQKTEAEAMKITLQEQRRKIQELEAEPVRLKQENESLHAELNCKKDQLKMALEQKKKHAEFMALGIKNQKHLLEVERMSHAHETEKFKSEIGNLNGRYSTLKDERDQLRQQLDKRHRENEELQSFVSDFSVEQVALQTRENDLKGRMQESVKEMHSLRNANINYKHKLEEAKKKLAKLEQRLEGNCSSVGTSARKHVNFSCEATSSQRNHSNSSPHTSSSPTKLSKRRVQCAEPESPSCQKPTQAKQFRMTLDTSLSSDPSNYSLDHKSQQEDLSRVYPPTTNAEANLVLPSLLGYDSKPFHGRSTKPLPKSSSASAIFGSGKPFALGPKSKLRPPCS